jgi:CcmD family protein
MWSNSTFIIVAYSVTWTVLLGYVVRLARGSARARAELARQTRDSRTGG